MESTSEYDSLDANDEQAEELPPPNNLRALNEVTCSKPSVGMEFDSLDDAYLFYNEYARVVGFSVRKAKTRKSNIDGSILFR